jgi:sulfur carrier protein
MKVQVNGNIVEFETAPTIQELLVAQKAEMLEYVTVQINDNFVPREEFDSRKVNDGDVLEFLYFMGGGRV